MTNKKLNSKILSQIVNEHVSADRKLAQLQEEESRINSLIERFNEGEEITEEELNEFLGGLGAVGKWGKDKLGGALAGAGQKIGQAASKAYDSAKSVAQDVKGQYDKGQRAAAINTQRKSVDKQQAANNKKVQDLVAKGKEVNDMLKSYQASLANIQAQYEKLTGKKFVPGRAVANAQRYVNESQKKK